MLGYWVVEWRGVGRGRRVRASLHDVKGAPFFVAGVGRLGPLKGSYQGVEPVGIGADADPVNCEISNVLTWTCKLAPTRK